MATTRQQLLARLAAEGQRSREQEMPEQSEADFWEEALRFGQNAAPIAGTVAGTAIGAGIGSLAGGVSAVPGAGIGGMIGGGIGQLAGTAAGMGADHMRGEREKMDRESEELEMKRNAKRQALLSLL